ncbi:MAG: alpha/beta hydrolase [Oscillospiraceae bacterium]|jgi:fermentation-respiration switch protein FrsA (DUF1100 family)|nr:alpha/beta hydrolase [Oscillospiraceae bacterium]
MDIFRIIAGLFGLLILLEAVTGFGIFWALCAPARKPATLKTSEHIRRAALREKNNAAFMALAPEDVAIQSFDGRLTLRGWYLPADKPIKRFALLAHGHHANGLNEFSHITPFYHDTLGCNILLPDHCGHGRSDGNWVGFGALDWKNLCLWIDWLIERFGDDIEIILHGISMGAATVLLLNENDPPPQVKLVIEDCGFASEKAELRSAGRMILGALEPLALPAYPIALMLQQLFAGYSAKESDPLGGMANAKCPVLFIHGGKDTFVTTRFVYELFDACPTPKRLFVVPDAIHAFSYWVDPNGYNEVVTEFIEEHIGNVAEHAVVRA